MIIKGLEKLSLSDFPGRLACVVFAPGCNLACPFCHNRDLVNNRAGLPVVTEREIFEFLRKRKKVLEAVVVSGGEPTLQASLLDFLRGIKNFGYLLKLDTNGTNPEILEKVLQERLVDYLALDVKTVLNTRQYLKFGLRGSISRVTQSLKLVGKSGISFELRTTVVPRLHNLTLLQNLARKLSNFFENKSGQTQTRWFLQTFRPGNCLDEQFNKEKPYSRGEMENLLEKVKPLFPLAELR